MGGTGKVMAKRAGEDTAGADNALDDDTLSAELRLTIALVLVARRWRSLVDESLRGIQQSSARMEALSAIANTPAPRTQVDIARRLRIEGPTMTRMLDTLGRAGLVERLPSETDRRSNHLELTDKGARVLAEIGERTEPMRERLLEGMSEAEIEELNATLRAMLGRLDDGLV